MYIEVRCPVHNKPLYGNGQTSTHILFKCPDCDYDGGEGAVRHDLPERFIALARQYSKLKAENEKLKISIECVIEDLKAWHCLADDCGRNNIERFVKDLEQTLKEKEF
jgi:hypothetical protein